MDTNNSEEEGSSESKKTKLGEYKETGMLKKKCEKARRKERQVDLSDEDFSNYHEFESLNFQSPFYEEMNRTQVPKRIKRPTVVKYDSITDLDNHMSSFVWAIWTIPMNRNLCCIFFAGTLEVSTRNWLESLPSKTISNYEDLCKNFTTSFIKKRRF